MLTVMRHIVLTGLVIGFGAVAPIGVAAQGHGAGDGGGNAGEQGNGGNTRPEERETHIVVLTPEEKRLAVCQNRQLREVSLSDDCKERLGLVGN